MAENVSSNVLFHFTRSMEHLKGILKNGFFPRYCPEYTLDTVDRKAASKRRPPKDENNILELHDYLMGLYVRRFSRKDAILVTTTIMTDDCIQEDV